MECAKAFEWLTTGTREKKTHVKKSLAPARIIIHFFIAIVGIDIELNQNCIFHKSISSSGIFRRSNLCVYL